MPPSGATFPGPTHSGPALADLAFDDEAARRLRQGRGLRFALREQVRAVGALLMREALTRYGNSRIGYLWAVIEPAAFISLFLVLRTYLGRAVPIGESLALFMLSGIVAARVVLSMVGKIGGAINANRALLVYPLLSPLDTIVARCILESMTGMVVLSLFFGGLLIVAPDVAIQDFATFTTAAAVMVLLACSIGTFNAVVGSIVPAWTRVWGMMSFPLFITSGAFFVPATLPPFALEIVWWNPILHIVEWFREGVYLDYLSVLDPLYPITLSLVLLGAAVTLERVFRLRVVSV